MLDEDMRAFPLVAVFIALICILLPIRKCINCVVGEKVELEPQYNKKYEEVYH